MGQFSTEIYIPPGSTLSGNQQPVPKAVAKLTKHHDMAVEAHLYRCNKQTIREHAAILNCRKVWSKRVDVDQTIGYNYSGNADALFNVVDRYAVHIKLPASAYVSAQRKAPAIAN